MKRTGFTLTEALTASVILAIVVLAVSQAILAGHAQVRRAAHIQRAGMLAEELIERAIAAGYNDAFDLDGYAEGPGETRDQAGVAHGEPFGAFSRSAAVRETTMQLSGLGDPVEGCEVEVTVTDDRGKSWKLTRFIARP